MGEPVAVAFLEAAVRLGTPLALAALGELMTERSGVLNLGIEGSLIAGALGAAFGALWSGDATTGIVMGAVAGFAVAALFAGFTIGLGTDQVITGTAVSIGAIGLTGVLYQAAFGVTGTALTLPTLGDVDLPLVSQIPVIGPVVFNATPTAYLSWLLAPLIWWFLFRTTAGLRLRAAGEDPDAAAALGVRVLRTRFWATCFGGLLAGTAGAHLALAHAGTFAENMSAGRGFIAIAVVVLGMWSPFTVLAAALFFGAASALQFQGQALGLGIPHQVFLALPYLLTLLALGTRFGRAKAPAALAAPWPERRP
ncbi:MAG: ABC transporter permease [Gemmatimonadetes bacterium]|nr:ABC transporter permease [Gemmatimonadota bacterium]